MVGGLGVMVRLVSESKGDRGFQPKSRLCLSHQTRVPTGATVPQTNKIPPASNNNRKVSLLNHLHTCSISLDIGSAIVGNPRRRCNSLLLSYSTTDRGCCMSANSSHHSLWRSLGNVLRLNASFYENISSTPKNRPLALIIVLMAAVSNMMV